jgi:hypothetical protein
MAASAAASKYTYISLESNSSLLSCSLRVLVLHPAKDTEAPLQCALNHSTYGEVIENYAKLRYNAISYTWGTDERSQPLLVDDDSPVGASEVLITPHVKQMLRGLRDKDDDVRLWIDAICVNQEDIDEKSVQVPRMDSVYRLAVTVLVWLGEGDTAVADALALLARFILLKESRGYSASTGGTALMHVIQSQGNIFETLLHHPWFSRRWILQEVSVAQNCYLVYRGDAWSWVEFRQGIEFLSQAQKGSIFGHTRLVDRKAQNAMQSILSLNRYSGNALDMLWDFHYADCKEKSDRIYALLGLMKGAAPNDQEVGASVVMNISSDAGLAELANLGETLKRAELDDGLALRPDYHKPWHELFTDVAAHFAERMAFSAITRHLHAFGSLHEENNDWPSWVPNWSRPRKAEPIRGLEKSTPIVPPMQINGRSLFVHGYKSDQVDTICTDWPHELTAFRTRVDGVVKTALQQQSEQAIDLGAEQQLRLMVGNLIRAGLALGLLDPIYEEGTTTVTLPYIFNDLAPTAISRLIFEPQGDAQSDGILAGAPISLRNASMFTTTAGLIGLASNRIRPEDIIIEIDHYHALPNTATTGHSDSTLFEVRSAAVLRTAGSRSSTECKAVGCPCGSTMRLYLLIGPCLLVSTKVTKNGTANKKQKYCII